MAVKVASQGGETRNVAWRQGMTAGGALKGAELKIPKGSTLTVNGRKAATTTKIRDKSVVVLTPKIKNG